jgi:hypothetical protein
MSTLAQTERVSSRRSRAGIVAAALGTLVVAAVVVVLLVASGSSKPATHQPALHQQAIAQPAVSWPLIQYRGTGAAPSTTAAHAAPAGQGAQPYLGHVQGLGPVQ